MPAILLVDDEPNILSILEHFVEGEGREILKATSGQEALDILRSRPIDVVISDISMPDMSGVQLLKEAKQTLPEPTFIVITAFASTETAIEALQHGAYDYLTKPLKMEDVRTIISQALKRKGPQADLEKPGAWTEAQQSQNLFQALQRNQILGKSPKMLDVFRTIGTVAVGNSTVLITGESGTGKEIIARAIHDASTRRDAPFVSINCGAFPETLLESELFGYMKGAFTGAVGNKKGLFEAANGGSIFLDEIGEMTAAMQVKLLRVLQDRRLRPLGGTQEVSVNVRVIAATNRNPQSAIQQGEFREDLYYRLAVITIHVPALRERSDDIELLAAHFLRTYSTKASKKILGVSKAAMQLLQKYHWPGNVRELENTIERAVALESGEWIQPELLTEAIKYPTATIQTPWDSVPLPDGHFDLDVFIGNLEKSFICQVLERTNGNQTQAAEYLNLPIRSLRHKIQRLGINAAAFKKQASHGS